MTTIFLKDGKVYADSKVTHPTNSTLKDIDRASYTGKIFPVRADKYVIGENKIIAAAVSGVVARGISILKGLENGAPKDTMGIDITVACRNMWPLIQNTFDSFTLIFFTIDSKKQVKAMELDEGGAIKEVKGAHASFGSGSRTINAWSHFLGFENLTAKELMQLTLHLDRSTGGEFKCFDVAAAKFVPVDAMNAKEKESFRKKFSKLLDEPRGFFEEGFE